MSTGRRSTSPLSRRAPNTFSPFRVSTGAKARLTIEEKTSYHFQSDVLFPSQYFATTHRMGYVETEKKLMLAVLEDAVACFRQYVAAPHLREKALFHEAKEWILDENNLWLFSFENICEVLGFNPVYLREGLMHWKEMELAKRSKAKD